MERKIDLIIGVLSVMRDKMDMMYAKLETIEARMDNVDAWMDSIDAQLGGVEKEVKATKNLARRNHTALKELKEDDRMILSEVERVHSIFEKKYEELDFRIRCG